MAIRYVDRRAQIGRVIAGLADVQSIFQGAHTPPVGRVGVVGANLNPLTAELAGGFTPSANRSGQIITTLGGANASIVGAHTAPAGSEVLTSWANLNLQANPRSRIDMSAAYPVWTDQGATHTNLPTGAWDGGPCARLTPTVNGDGYCALGAFNNLNRGGALAIRQFGLRIELLNGPTWGAGQQSKSDNKFFIIHAGPTNNATSAHRPMVNIWPEGGTLSSVAVACGTVKQFNPNPPPNDFFPGSGRSSFYFGDSGTTGGPGNKPIVPANEWVTFEFHGSAIPIAGFPNGCIRLRVTRRTGQVMTTLSIPWNYDSSWSPVDYFNEVQVLGGYLNGSGGPANSGNFQLIAGVTFFANFLDFQGPRAGFVQA